MRVILLKDVKGVGRQFEEKEVSEGYARNFLFLKKLAVPADEAHKGIRKEHEAKERTIAHEAEVVSKKIKDHPLIFAVVTGKNSEVFGSVSDKDIQKKIAAELSVSVEVPAIHLKTLGAHEVKVKLPRGVIAIARVELVAKK